MAEHCEEEPGPSASKKKRLQGAATYRSKFNPDWTKEFSFIVLILTGNNEWLVLSCKVYSVNLPIMAIF